MIHAMGEGNAQHNNAHINMNSYDLLALSSTTGQETSEQVVGIDI